MIIGRRGKKDNYGIYEPRLEAGSTVYCVIGFGQLEMLSG